MRKSKQFYFPIICFLLGAIVSYLLSQHRFLIIDAKVNVVTALTSLVTCAVGLYIATAIKNAQTQKQKVSEMLSARIENEWNSFLKIVDSIVSGNKIELSRLSRYHKTASLHNQMIVLITKQFNISEEPFCNLDKKIDQFESEMNRLPIQSNCIKLEGSMAHILNIVDEVNKSFCECLQAISKVIS